MSTAHQAKEGALPLPFLYIENHSLGEWFKKAYGDEGDKKTPFVIIKVRSANCAKITKGGHSTWD